MRQQNVLIGLVFAAFFIIAQSIPAVAAEEPLREKVRQFLQEQKKPIQTPSSQAQENLPESIDALGFDSNAVYMVSIRETSQAAFAVLVSLEPIDFVYHNAWPREARIPPVGCTLYKEFRSANDALAWAQPFIKRQVTGAGFLKKYEGREVSGIIYTYSSFNVKPSRD